MKRLLLLIVFVCITGYLGFHFFKPKANAFKPGKYVWSMGFAYDCDVTLLKWKGKHPRHYLNADKIKRGDVVWVQLRQVPNFYNDFLPKIQHPVVLVITDGDESFPSSCATSIDPEKLIRSDKIIHIFAQNCDYTGDSGKVTHLPLGIDLHSLAQKGGFFSEKKLQTSSNQEKVLEEVISHLKPTHLRKRQALVDFHFYDSIRHGNMKRYLVLGEDRTSILQKILPSGTVIPLEKHIPRKELWKQKGEYAFSVAPQGNGMDTHRLWEDLLLGCIVITKTSPLDPLYEGLPVVIVKDWSEINEEHLTRWLEQYGDAFTNPAYREKLTHAYWRNKIRQKSNTARI